MMATRQKPYRVVAAVTNDLLQDQRMHRICTTLATGGYQVSLIGRQHRGRSVHTFNSKPNEVWLRLGCLFRRGFLFYAEYNLRLLLFLLQHPFDAVCAVDSDTLPACFIAAKLKKKPCILDAHEYFSEVPELVDRPFVKFFWEAVASFFIPRIKFAYTVGPYLAKLLSARYGIHFEVIRNLPRFRIPREQASHPGKPFIILYQGMLNEGRGLEPAIQSLHQLDNIQLWIAGKGDIEAELAQQAVPFINTGKIIWWGFLPPDELNALTPKADLGLNLLENKGLSYYYSLANKAFDYIQAGIPSLQMKFPEYTSLHNEYEVFSFVDDTKPESIAKAICYLQQNPEAYRRLRANCLRAAEKLNWEAESAKLLNFYQHIFCFPTAQSD
jgi:glycosyltransferase involved in cell wall biosynthesis